MNKPLSVDDIKRQRKPIRNANRVHKENLTSLELFAVWVTEKIGSMGFFFIILFWTVLWLGWNIFMPNELRFDPYPAFVFWLFISNMLQIFLMPLIMVGQNLQGKHAEVRAEADFEINQRSEEEIETILVHLENQNEVLADILKKIDK